MVRDFHYLDSTLYWNLFGTLKTTPIWCCPSHLPIDGNRSINDAMHAQDGRLWRVDDWCAKHRTKYPTVGDGECSPVHVFYGQGVITSLGERREEEGDGREERGREREGRREEGRKGRGEDLVALKKYVARVITAASHMS